MEQIIFDKDVWSGWLKAKGLSPRTLKEYGYYFDKFDFERLSQQYIIEYINRQNNIVARAFLKNLFHFIRTNDFPREIKLLISEIEILQNEKPDGGGDPSGLSKLINSWEEERCQSKSKGAGRRSAPFDDLNLAFLSWMKIPDIAMQPCRKRMIRR